MGKPELPETTLTNDFQRPLVYLQPRMDENHPENEENYHFYGWKQNAITELPLKEKQGTIKSHIQTKDPIKFDTPSERYDSSVQYSLVDNDDNQNNNQAEKEYMKDDFASEPQKSPSRSFYSIVESAFPEHKYLQNQRTTYVESNNALNPEARTFDETSQKSSQTNIRENYANTAVLATPKYNVRKATTYPDSRKDESNNHSELNSLNPPSISYSSTWQLAEGSSNLKTSSQEDQYISNLIRDSKNYKFGKISL